ncbi:ATPase [Nonomuraea sp. MG754425]|uniref:ATP-binding protein n=1 Tax=Nonomuraea sp. MG754425 TaxID=2570319 RepID=UPI0027DF4451|nr:LuxR C-terminal-related transcriptional regulator [Nonomuraea sp. MG754425]MCF6467228.1 ATPase [Nonomuraea sp. MG754425]
MATEAEISPREAEVLELVGAHLSNAEIAARLCISVRTVESHVSSLLRKLEVPDRRALARRAPEPAGAAPSRPAPVLPAPLTSFVGRVSERAELAELIRTHRQVSAVGPGGVGKTRLALAAAGQAAGEYADGVWFVDLVPVTDPDLIATAVAGAIGLGEQRGRDMTESVVTALADRHALLVLDNCEQVADGVALLVGRLLATCPRVTVLATSRARLMVPFERVYPVPPLSLAADGGSDAVTLFLERAAAVGGPPAPPLRDQIAAICERLDGMALAIELAAARYPTLGLDGITAALSHPLRMLTGGSRADERHRSVRAALDWSHALLEPADRALLGRVSVFVAPFTAAAAVEVAGGEAAIVAEGLARLAEQSLLVVTASPGGTQYRALETIRQYATERLAEAGELDGTRSRHLRWCLAEATGLTVVGQDWRARFDLVADDLRAALAWAAERPEQRARAYELARHLAELTFTRHLSSEAQRRYEQAAGLAGDPGVTASMLRQAAAVAGCRTIGDDMYRLRRAAADAARGSGDPAGAAADLASAATIAFRFSATFVRVPPGQEAVALIDEARELAGDDPAALAALALAEAAVLADAFGAVQGPPGNAVPDTIERAERAVELARRTGDPLAESAALDALTCAHVWAGDTFATAALSRRRITLLSSLPVSPAGTQELIDALGMVAEAGLGTGDVPGARRWARQLADHPSLAEVGHRAPLMVAALAGDVEEVLAGSVRLLDAWRRAGSPARAYLGPAVAAVALSHGLRDDHDAQREWQQILDQLGTLPERTYGYGAVYDAILLLHRGQAHEALERTAPDTRQVWKWVTWIWHHWYVALRTEAAVLAGSPDARDRLAEARTAVAGNPVAGALVERAGALLDGDREALLATADAFDAAGCRYQAARTLVLAGGDHARRGAATLADLALAPMAPASNPPQAPDGHLGF